MNAKNMTVSVAVAMLLMAVGVTTPAYAIPIDVTWPTDTITAFWSGPHGNSSGESLAIDNLTPTNNDNKWFATGEGFYYG